MAVVFPPANQPSSVQHARRPLTQYAAWLNQMASQGQLISAIAGDQHSFSPVTPGSWTVQVEPCLRTWGQKRVAGPASAVLLASDPTCHVVSAERAELVTVRPAWTPPTDQGDQGQPVPSPDPLARLHPVARLASYRYLIRQCHRTATIYFGLAVVIVAIGIWLATVVAAPLRDATFGLGPAIAALVVSGVVLLALAGWVAWLGTISLRLAGTTADLVGTASSTTGPPPLAPNQSVVNRPRSNPLAQAQWLDDQAARGQTLISFDGGNEYIFETTNPGQYTIASEATGPGFDPIFLVNAIGQAPQPSPGQALTTQPGAQVVCWAPDWVIARRPAQDGPLIPPGSPDQIAAAYAAAAGQTRRGVSRTLVAVVIFAIGIVVTLLGVSLTTGTVALPLASAILFAAALALFAAQAVRLARRSTALKSWADRYSQRPGLLR